MDRSDNTPDFDNTQSPKQAPPQDEADGLDSLLRPRTSRRSRVMRSALVVALVLVVAIGLIWRTTGFLKVPGLQPVAHTTATSPFVKPAQVLIASNAKSGTLRLDNVMLASPPPVVVTLAPGNHRISLAANSIGTSDCSVLLMAVLTTTSGECGTSIFATDDNGSQGSQSGQVRFEVILEVSGKVLSPDQCMRLRSAITDDLAAAGLTAAVPRGQYIATGSDQDGLPISQRAGESLTAHLTATPTLTSDQTCEDLQPGMDLGPAIAGLVPDMTWAVAMPVTLHLWFTRGNGEVVAHAPDELGTFNLFLAFSNPASRWIVLPDSVTQRFAQAYGFQDIADQYAQAHCSDGAYRLVTALSSATDISIESGADDSHGLSGCLIQVETIGQTSYNPPLGYVWRFGALLAVDSRAHKLLARLPLAPSAEVQAVPSVQ